MSVEKIKKTVLLCTCELKGCRKSWQSQDEEIPDRCRWCGRRTWNGQNKRLHLITAKGKTLPIFEWAEKTGLGRATILARLNAGWSDEDAVGIPVGRRRTKHG